jgi:hypothetical protein
MRAGTLATPFSFHRQMLLPLLCQLDIARRAHKCASNKRFRVMRYGSVNSFRDHESISLVLDGVALFKFAMTGETTRVVGPILTAGFGDKRILNARVRILESYRLQY